MLCDLPDLFLFDKKGMARNRDVSARIFNRKMQELATNYLPFETAIAPHTNSFGHTFVCFQGVFEKHQLQICSDDISRPGAYAGENGSRQCTSTQESKETHDTDFVMSITIDCNSAWGFGTDLIT